MKRPATQPRRTRIAADLSAVRGGTTDAATDAPAADVTSVMKPKYDTVKNSITNVR